MSDSQPAQAHADFCRDLADLLGAEGWAWDGVFTERGTAILRSQGHGFELRIHQTKNAVYGGARTIRITGHFGPLNSRIFPEVSSTLRLPKTAGEIADYITSNLVPRCGRALDEAKSRVREDEAEHLRDYELASSLYAPSGGRIVVADTEAPVGRPWRLKSAPRPKNDLAALPHKGPWYLIGGEVMFGRIDLHLGSLTPDQARDVLRLLADADRGPEP